MGSGNQTFLINNTNKEKFNRQLQLVEHRDELNWGFITIYQKQQSPYEYIMDYPKTFIEADHRIDEYVTFMNSLKSLEHKNIVKIFTNQFVQEIHLCIKEKQVHTYVNYYNFTLAQAIERKKQIKCQFPQSQLLYILNCLLEVSVYLQQHQIAYSNYRSNSVYLSPQGYIKIYLLEIQPMNKHNSYFKALSEKDKIPQLVLSPQQLYYIAKNEYEIRYDVYKSEVFTIALLILELITLDHNKFYYNDRFTQLKIDRIMFDLNQIQQKYSPTFSALLRSCLQPNPHQRYSLQSALEESQNIKKNSIHVSYCIRLKDDDEKKYKQNNKQIKMAVKSQIILNGLQKRLMPSPINTLSSSSSSNFKSQLKNYQPLSNIK